MTRQSDREALADEVEYCLRAGIDPNLSSRGWESVIAALRSGSAGTAGMRELADRIDTSAGLSITETVCDRYNLHSAYYQREADLETNDVAMIVAALRAALANPPQGDE